MMPPRRVTLIHWKPDEAAQRAEQLRDAGYEVTAPTIEGLESLRALREEPPDTIVIDLDRLPSQGRDVAVWLRRHKDSRGIPIVFLGGRSAKVARIRELLPDAVFGSWNEVADAVGRAVARPPVDPVAPDLMAAYSGAPLAQKLRITAGSVVALLDSPQGFERTLGPLPAGVKLSSSARGPADVVLLFATSMDRLERRFPAALRALAERGALWIAWPKKASDIVSDLDQSRVRAFGLDAGLVDYKICAVDATWSGLCFARRQARGRKS